MQYGFRPRRGCADATFILKCGMDRFMRKGKSWFFCFIDISKAYDFIDRNTAWNNLLHTGPPSKVVSWLRDMHSHTCCPVRLPGMGLGAQFTIETGFKLRDAISPMSFNFALRFGYTDKNSTVRGARGTNSLSRRWSAPWQSHSHFHSPWVRVYPALRSWYCFTTRVLSWAKVYGWSCSRSIPGLESWISTKQRLMQLGPCPPVRNDFFLTGKMIEMAESFKFLRTQI
jgi:hypothetical protein